MSTAVDQQQLSDWTDAFARDGHICLPQFLAGDALEELQDNLDRYIRDVVPGLPATHAFYENREDPATLKQMQYMQDEDSFFAELIRRDCFVDVAKSFLGENVITQGAEYFNKPAGLGKATPPHQDGYYFCLVPNKAVTFWIALDVVDEENGCLRYVTGSHNERRPSARGVSDLGIFARRSRLGTGRRSPRDEVHTATGRCAGPSFADHTPRRCQHQRPLAPRHGLGLFR